MKISILLSAGALAVSSLPLVAQQAGAAVAQSSTASPAGVSASQSAAANAGAGPVSAQANGSSSAHSEMRPVKAELLGKLDSKSAKAGDPVMVKTTEKARTADGIEIPKGSRLIGHVVAAQAHESGHADSSMSLVFDRAELKGGQSLAIHSVIETIAPPANAIADSSFDSDSSLAAPIGGGARSGGRAGAGLVGGGLGTAGSAAGGATSALGSTTGGALHTATGLTADTAAGVGNGLGATTGAAGSSAAHSTAIPGVMLASDVSGSASNTLSASRRNIHLESGTQVVMGLSAAVQ